MSVLCIGGICIPYSVLWPLLVIALKTVWDYVKAIFVGKDETPKKVTTTAATAPSASSSTAQDTKFRAGCDPFYLTNEMNFKSLTQQGRPTTFVRFTAPWCKPCKAIEPFFLKLASDHSNCVFFSVDVDEHEEIAAECRAIQIPHIVAFKDGAIVGSVSGKDEEKISSFVNLHDTDAKVLQE